MQSFEYYITKDHFSMPNGQSKCKKIIFKFVFIRSLKPDCPVDLIKKDIIHVSLEQDETRKINPIQIRIIIQNTYQLHNIQKLILNIG